MVCLMGVESEPVVVNLLGLALYSSLTESVMAASPVRLEELSALLSPKITLLAELTASVMRSIFAVEEG